MKMRASIRRNSGFTLLEMMLTLAIFILLVAAVFGLMTGVLQSTAILQDSQNRRDKVNALDAYIKARLGSLPANASLVSYLRGTGDGLNQNGILYGNASQATAIDAVTQPNGYYTLRVTTYVPDTSQAQAGRPQDARQLLNQLVTTDDPTLNWRPLVTDIKTLDWKFQDFNATDWAELWNSNTKPNLIEFTMQVAADLQPVTMDFWLPALATPSLGSGNRQRTSQ